METIELEVVEREGNGSTASRKLRREGIVPGVLYGGTNGGEVLPFGITEYQYQYRIKNTVPSQVFKLASANKALDGTMVLVKDVQTEPIKSKALHIDMVKLTEGREVSVYAPIEMVGTCDAVKQGVAVLSQTAHEIEVTCVPSKIPSSLELDLSKLTEGNSLHASDVTLPEGVSLKTDPSVTIIAAISKRRAGKDDADADAAEPAAATEGASS